MRTLAIAALTMMPAVALAQSVPTLMPVQGILTDADGQRLDGTFNTTFTQWDAEAGGNVLLQESVPLVVENGLFAAYLEVDPALLNGDVWLGVEVESDGEMPRFLLGTAPYAGVAQISRDADLFQGRAAADFANAVHNHDYSEIQNPPPDTTYQAGTGIAIDANNNISVQSSFVRTEAQAACFDTEAELQAVLDDDYASTNHVHPPPVAPALDCVETTATLNFPAGNTNLNATCAVGRTITGGGYAITGNISPQDLSVFTARTNTASRRFEVVHSYVGTGMGTLTVYAVCCRLQ